MIIATWNVNSIRVRLPRLLALLDRHAPDVLCLQETKVEDRLFPHEALAGAGYRAVCHGQKTYNGVAILAREAHAIEDVAKGFAGDPIPEQARVIWARVAGLEIASVYVVNGKAVGTEAYDLKLRWLDAFSACAAARARGGGQVVLAGDFNVAPEDRDVHDPDAWRGRILCSEPERERIRGLLSVGYTDLFRLHCAEGGHFTWWDYRGGAFRRGHGLRIDLILGTRAAASRCTACLIDREERRQTTGEGKPSDHAPVLATLGGA